MRRLTPVLFLLAACAGEDLGDPERDGGEGRVVRDAGDVRDGGAGRDAGDDHDGGDLRDGGGDGGAIHDGGDARDGGDIDASLPDAGGTDAGGTDAGTIDGGVFTVSVTTTSTGGHVTSSPGNILCTDPPTGPCSDVFPAGTTVTLTASAAADFAFDRWSQDCLGTNTATASLLVDADRQCTAHFIQTAGEVALVPPPTSVVPNTTEDPTNILIFREQTDVALPAGVPFDIHVPDRFTSFLLAGGTFPAGLRVNVYFLHFDPPGASSTRTHRVATLRFGERILGLIADTPTLVATDAIFGLGTVVYPAGGTHADRRLELTGTDIITVRGDRRTVDIDFMTSTSSDQVRIVTLATRQALVPMLHNDHVELLTPPSVVLNASESNTAMRLFEESSTVLAADLAVDTATTGTYTGFGQLLPATIPSGTAVTSWMMHFDPASGTRNLDATVTFEAEILGVIVADTSLDATDFLGHPMVTYPIAGSAPARTVELSGSEFVSILGDRRSLRFRAAASNATDQVRIILAN
ncbi:MAG: hypothetical protein RIT81_18245 [Deltaproteobacteria bacterium]